MKTTLLSLLLFIGYTSTGQTPVSTYGPGVTFNGHHYRTIILGNGQEWFAENLQSKAYCNGDTINSFVDHPYLTTWTQWSNGAILCNAAWCSIYDDPSYDSIYGKLYTHYAVNDERNICPCGWHVATNSDWDGLILYLDPSATLYTGTTITINYVVSTVAGDMLKTFNYWNGPNTLTNFIGFDAVPAGYRHETGYWDQLGYRAMWWSASTSTGWGFVRTLENNNSHGIVYAGHLWPTYGLSVRCVRSSTTEINEIAPSKEKHLIKSIDMLGREIDPNTTGFKINIYSDGSIQRYFKQ